MEHYFTNNNLKSEIRYLKYTYEAYNFLFASDNGVFAKNKLDYGSMLLVDTILKNKEETNLLLDVGCGYGFIGITLAKVLNCKVLLSDVNKRALHLCELNIKENKVKGEVIESNSYEKIKGKYDMIVTNPPIRAGKKVVLEILEKAKDYLEDEGTLWFVINKDQGAKSMKKELEKSYLIDILNKNKGFYIFRAKKR